ncbi:MAG TPA: hypothetical protein VG929_00165 [Actinomycetota bacterium]|nr:hypothetical protein [Actinomycetota bacterium]
MSRRIGSRRIALLLAATLVTGAFTALAPAPAGACGAVLRNKDVFRSLRDSSSDSSTRGGAMETIGLRTLHLEYKADKKIYEIGDIAQIKVTVTRPADEDPLGQGIPMDRPFVEPAADVNVGVGLSIGRVFLPGAGLTNEKGVAIVKIKIENYAPAGKWADASAYAWRVVQSTPCATVQEDGYRIQPRMFRTAPRI